MVILIIHHTCGCGYKSRVMGLKTALNIKTEMFLLQKSFIGNCKISHSAFHFYWLQEKRSEIRVVTSIRKDLIDKLIMENKTDLVNHLYFILREIWELDQLSKKLGRKTRALNIYYNYVSCSCT